MAKMLDDKRILTGARIELHLNGGYTILILDMGGSPLQVETDRIPPSLRAVGARILVTLIPSNPRVGKSGSVIYDYKQYDIGELKEEV